MKMINGFIVLAIASACVGCATQPPRTLSALPDTQPSSKAYYQRIVEDGQVRYCRTVPVRANTESRVVCLTEAQLQAEQLQQLSQARLVEDGVRPPTPNLDSRQAAIQLQQSAANIPGYVGH